MTRFVRFRTEYLTRQYAFQRKVGIFLETTIPQIDQNSQIQKQIEKLPNFAVFILQIFQLAC